MFPIRLFGYSVLTHEAIIDSAWDNSIKPLLLQRFPHSSSDDLIEAHSYAYGGCIIQDMGYYPFGNKFFTDLMHYVQTGDFVENLIRDSEDLNEYAFALGALSHYAADIQGHPIAINASVPIQYPKLRRKYGDVVTYEDDPVAHIRVEFGFDVLQVARGNYTPASYHDYIGFHVARSVLERAFRDTYSLELTDVFANLDLALGTYRRTASIIIPEMTKVAWKLKHNDIKRSAPHATRRTFVYNLSAADYRKEWSSKYDKPGIGAQLLAIFIRILPKIGPFKALAVKLPTAQTERLFETSFDSSLAEYRRLLRAESEKRLHPDSRDLDIGTRTRPGNYWMADNAFAKLAIRLSGRDPASVNPKVRQSILDYFSDLNIPFATKTRDPKLWQQTLAALDKLKSDTPGGRR